MSNASLNHNKSAKVRFVRGLPWVGVLGEGRQAAGVHVSPHVNVDRRVRLGELRRQRDALSGQRRDRGPGQRQPRHASSLLKASVQKSHGNQRRRRRRREHCPYWWSYTGKHQVSFLDTIITSSPCLSGRMFSPEMIATALIKYVCIFSCNTAGEDRRMLIRGAGRERERER